MSENSYNILSPEEAMNELQIGRNAIYKLLALGELKAFKVGHNWKIPRKSVGDYIDTKLKNN